MAVVYQTISQLTALTISNPQTDLKEVEVGGVSKKGILGEFRNSSGNVILKMLNNGNVGIGTDAPTALVDLEIDQGNTEMYLTSYKNTDSGGFIRLNKARGTQATPTIVGDGDLLGALIGRGYDGSTFANSASIQLNIDGTPGSNDMPGRIEFNTSPDGSAILERRMVIDSVGNVGIGIENPTVGLDILTSSSIQLKLTDSITDITTKNTKIVLAHYTNAEEPVALMFGVQSGSHNTINFGGGTGTLNAATRINFYTAANNTSLTGSHRMGILENGNVGIGTTVPGQIFDVNQGSGNMIADGYDNHSLAKYKDNIENLTDNLSILSQLKVRKWNRKPKVSADELRELVIQEFGKGRWDEIYPKNNYRGGALRECEDVEVLEYMNNMAKELRSERRGLPEWQRTHYGLVADEIPNDNTIASRNQKGDVVGYSINNYIGLLHGCINELTERIEMLEGT